MMYKITFMFSSSLYCLGIHSSSHKSHSLSDPGAITLIDTVHHCSSFIYSIIYIDPVHEYNQTVRSFKIEHKLRVRWVQWFFDLKIGGKNVKVWEYVQLYLYWMILWLVFFINWYSVGQILKLILQYFLIMSDLKPQRSLFF